MSVDHSLFCRIFDTSNKPASLRLAWAKTESSSFKSQMVWWNRMRKYTYTHYSSEQPFHRCFWFLQNSPTCFFSTNNSW